MKPRLVAFIILLTLILSACGKVAEGGGSEDGERAEEVGVTELTLATMGGSNFSRIVDRFNEENELGIVIKLVNYIDYEAPTGAGRRESAITRLDMELSTGKGPDIIDFETFPKREIYAKRGLLADMSEYFRRDLRMEDYYVLPLLAAPELYFFPSHFQVATCYGRSDVFQGRESWSFEEYEAMVSSPDLAPVRRESRDLFLQNACVSMIPSCVDWVSMTCRFDDGRFAEFLRLVADMSETFEYDELSEYPDGGEILYRATEIRNPVDVRRIERAVGASVDFVGFPTADGSSGSYVYLYTLVGVSRHSEHPEAAWEFIKFMLSDDELQRSYVSSSIPVKKSLTDEYLEKLQNPYAEYEGKAITVNEDGTFEVDGEHMDATYDPSPMLSEAQLAKYYRLIETAKNLYYYDDNVYAIIRQEADKYFSGASSLEAAVENIQSRVSLYLAEQG